MSLVVYILNGRKHLGKFDSKCNNGVFLGYSMNSNAYRVYKMGTQTIMESINVVVDDANDLSDFLKEENISSLIEESSDEVGLSQPAKTPRKIDFGHSDFFAIGDTITTETDQTESSK